uniref:Lipase domain-containing protein n=1 Tax=Heliothis virescens TaxID=7102 RepID=A0A2A4J690_HELVI
MVRFIGVELGKLLAALVDAGLHPSDIHLIGHSLGSHISGFAGKSFTDLTGHRVGRITGLDPAGPCFSDVIETFRLNVRDADFVDVIHSNAGVFGVTEPIGHVDFYPNGGSLQPNCPPAAVSCSHSRAWLLFAESVLRPQAFIGVSCDSWQAFREGKCDYQNLSVMGYGCQNGTRGTYYLQTGDGEPYGRGIEGTRFVNNEGLLRNIQNALGGPRG